MNKLSFFGLLSFLFILISCSDQKQEPETGTIKAGNLQVYYERTGDGEPILLLHAGLQDHTMWDEQVKALSAKYQVITPDLPYHGKTTGSDTTNLAQDVIKMLLDSLHLQKIYIAGLSMGASITQDFIIAYPERVYKAVLIAAGINGYEKTHPIDSISMDWYPRFRQALEEKDTARAATEFTKAWAEGVYRRGDSLKAAASQYVYRSTLANLRLHKMEGWPRLKNDPPAMESLASIKVPVLIIDGDKDLPYIAASALYLEKTIPNAKRVVMKNVAHMLNMEKPGELNNLLLDFLKHP